MLTANLEENGDNFCELWCEEHVEMKPHSRLYPLETIGVESPLVESLTSYINRLAESHSVYPFRLIAREVLPNISHPTTLYQGNLLKSRRLTKFWEKSAMLNGHSDTSLHYVQALERLTLSHSLGSMTMLFWSDILSARGLLHRTRSWCPSCFEEWREMNKIVYEPLLWSLRVVRICPRHLRLLQMSCHSCGTASPPLTPRSQVGYCPRCNQWLGNYSKEGDPTQKLSEDLDWEREQWIADSVGEMLAKTHNRPTCPSRRTISQPIREYAKALGLSPLTKRLARQLGIDDATLRSWLRDEQSPCLDSLLHMCHRFGVTPLQFLTSDEVTPTRNRALLSVSSRTPQWERRRFEAAQIRTALESIIKHIEEPPPSMHDVSKRLGFAETHLKRHFPDLCRAISARYRAYVQKRKLERIQEISEEVRRIVRLIYAQNRYPGIAQVEKLLSPHFSSREKAVKEAWKDELRQLGLLQ